MESDKKKKTIHNVSFVNRMSLFTISFEDIGILDLSFRNYGHDLGFICSCRDEVDVMDSECSRARLRSSATLDVLWSEEIIIGGHPGREQQPQNGKHPIE